jgi:hypothetical protein
MDLIVMTTHGRGGLSRVLLGSVADGLVQQTSVPVLLIRSDLTNRSTFDASASTAPDDHAQIEGLAPSAAT